MTNNKKRALFSSAIALILCCAMLVGTTFAWFTDSETSASNVIKSGNLDVEVQYTLDGKTWADLDGATNLFQKGLWEPGHTEVVALKIENKGSLALKYAANLNVIHEEKGINVAGNEFALSDILTVTTVTQQVNEIGNILLGLVFSGANNTDTSNVKPFKEAQSLAVDQSLLPDDAHYVIVTVDMPESVANEANHNGTKVPEINFGVNILATQLPNEYDSFGNQYDKDAEMPVMVYDNAGLEEALASGDNAIVNLASGNYTFPASKLKAGQTLNCEEGTVFDGKTGLNINGATIVGATFTNNNDYLVNSTTINGTFKDCVFTNCDGLRYCYAGETVVFENCVFDTDFYGVHFDGGENEVVFRNCTFSGFNTFGSDLKKLTMENCTFKYNGKGGYNGINMWGNTDMIGCTFVFDDSASYEWVDLASSNQTVSFTNCVVTNGTTETPIKDVVGNYGDNNTIIIDGVTVDIPKMN